MAMGRVLLAGRVTIVLISAQIWKWRVQTVLTVHLARVVAPRALLDTTVRTPIKQLSLNVRQEALVLVDKCPVLLVWRDTTVHREQVPR
jgi:hypothetical protein